METNVENFTVSFYNRVFTTKQVVDLQGTNLDKELWNNERNYNLSVIIELVWYANPDGTNYSEHKVVVGSKPGYFTSEEEVLDFLHTIFYKG